MKVPAARLTELIVNFSALGSVAACGSAKTMMSDQLAVAALTLAGSKVLSEVSVTAAEPPIASAKELSLTESVQSAVPPRLALPRRPRGAGVAAPVDDAGVEESGAVCAARAGSLDGVVSVRTGSGVTVVDDSVDDGAEAGAAAVSGFVAATSPLTTVVFGVGSELVG